MRIAACGADTMGDLILRQPLFAALQAAGHELLLAMRPEWKPLAPLLAPGALVVPIPPQARLLEGEGSPELGAFLAQVRAQAPDLLLTTPWNVTWAEERLAAALADVPCIGLRGMLKETPQALRRPTQIRFAQAIELDETVHESEKNRRLAEAVLGPLPTWPTPRLDVPAPLQERARQRLSGFGWQAGEYWVAAVASSPAKRHRHMRNWREESWAELLRHFLTRHGRRLLLVGTPDEQPMCRRIQAALLDVGDVRICDEPASDLDELIGLTALADGYIGRDTGPMHLAAALGKPVLALFGSGHWPRFVPLAQRGRVVRLDVPCLMCGWCCHHNEVYCVQEIPAAAMIAALDDLQAGGPDGVHVHTLPRSAELARRMELEPAASLLTLQRQRTEQIQRLRQIRRELADSRAQLSALTGARWHRVGLALRLAKQPPGRTSA